MYVKNYLNSLQGSNLFVIVFNYLAFEKVLRNWGRDFKMECKKPKWKSYTISITPKKKKLYRKMLIFCFRRLYFSPTFSQKQVLKNTKLSFSLDRFMSSDPVVKHGY